MKKNFKKILSVFLVVLMLWSVFSVSVSAAYTITLMFVEKNMGGTTVYGDLVTDKQSLRNFTIDGTRYTVKSQTKNGEKVYYVTFRTNNDNTITFPDYFFEMDYHGAQIGWSTSSDPGAEDTIYKKGDGYTATKATTFYPVFKANTSTVTYNPGEADNGEPIVNADIPYNEIITLLGETYSRKGYKQNGWYTESPYTEYALGQGNINVTSDMTFYPLWQKINYSIEQDIFSLSFDTVCEDYPSVDLQYVTITNKSDVAITLDAVNDPYFDVTYEGTGKVAVNRTLKIGITPKIGLDAGVYTSTINLSFDNGSVATTITAAFSPRAHMFVKYVSNNDATYVYDKNGNGIIDRSDDPLLDETGDGTETAPCHLNCGYGFDTRRVEGSGKIYSADNNAADGLLKEYLYHKTVNFVAFGSGMDDAEGYVGKRFRPVSWRVNDTFNGEFTAKDSYDPADYTVKYVHKDYGTFDLEIKYVEEKFENNEWVATGVEDVKTFKYSIGPSEKDEQEVERPKTIVSLIFGLMGWLVDLVSGMIK